MSLMDSLVSVESWSPVGGGHTLDNVFDGQPGVCRALEPVGGRHTLDNVFDGQPGVCRALEPGGGGTP